ncbi:hypothetical protein [Aneurinibacillus aneurinilyticus]|uniref:hypothetical protein n=1 Tax=Aneurinibacillus aneurinilyticus TaxID=1391 RepID=UPI002E233370|nr:hypothetical protein [Aneurinibacillus aneurinilyticus]
MVIYTSNEGYITGVWLGAKKRSVPGDRRLAGVCRGVTAGDDLPALGAKKRNASGPKSP